MYVTYVVGDEEVTVHMTEADFQDGDWTKTIAGVEYWLWLFDLADDDGMISLIAGRADDRLYATAGLRTATADLPSGTAVYEGSMRGDSHLANDASAGRLNMIGSLRLTVDFDEGSLEGRISELEVRPDDPRVWRNLPNTTHFAIDDGRIVDGQFTASLTGMDSNANAAMDEKTVRGYEGGVLGEFYGPSAEEVGGVLNASRDDRVMAGAFRRWEAAAVSWLPRLRPDAHAAVAIALLIATAVCADPVPPEAARPPPEISDMQAGRLLIGAGRLEHARAFLEQARPASEEGRIERLVLLGRIELHLGMPRRAAERFEAVLARRPGLTAVRLELARAYYLAGIDDNARHHFSLSRAEELPSTVEATVEEFLRRIDARKRWSVSVSASVLPKT